MRSSTPLLSRRTLIKGASLAAASAVPVAALSSSFGSGLLELFDMQTSALAASNPQPVPPGTLTSAPMTVTSTSAGSIPDLFTGLSYEKSSLYEPLFTGTNSDLIGLFKLIAPGVLRIGGNSVDETIWVQDGPGQVKGHVSPPDVQALAAFIKAAGWKVIYGVNLGGSATGVQTPALAAAEANYASQQLGSALLGIEIGNECDLYGNAGSYYAGNWSLSQFVALWQHSPGHRCGRIP